MFYLASLIVWPAVMLAYVLADMINQSLKHVSGDLQPVSEVNAALSNQVPDD